jgi:hypothetical protein
VNHSAWVGDVLRGLIRVKDGASAVSSGRETLPETLQEALGNALVRAYSREGSDPAKVDKAFRNCHTLTHLELFRLIGGGTHERDVSAFLNRAAELEVQYGRMLWDRDLVAQDLEAERTGRILPRASNAPRLFISYRWSFDESYDEDLSLIIHEFVGWLFGRGYDIVYDRDPRHIAKRFSSDEILWLLPSCSQMIVMVTDGYQNRILDPQCTSPACQEFALAPYLYRANKQPRLLGLWFQGDQLRAPVFSKEWIVDFRDQDVFLQHREATFPVRQYQIECHDEGKVEVLGPMRRVAVRPTIDRLFADNPARRVLVRDVTNVAKYV